MILRVKGVELETVRYEYRGSSLQDVIDLNLDLAERGWEEIVVCADGCCINERGRMDGEVQRKEQRGCFRY